MLTLTCFLLSEHAIVCFSLELGLHQVADRAAQRRQARLSILVVVLVACNGANALGPCVGLWAPDDLEVDHEAGLESCVADHQ